MPTPQKKTDLSDCPLPASDYAYLRDIARTGWAWEWLRRNLAYRAQFADLPKPVPERCAVVNAGPATAGAAFWGLHFRRAS